MQHMWRVRHTGALMLTMLAGYRFVALYYLFNYVGFYFCAGYYGANCDSV